MAAGKYEKKKRKEGEKKKKMDSYNG